MVVVVVVVYLKTCIFEAYSLALLLLCYNSFFVLIFVIIIRMKPYLLRGHYFKCICCVICGKLDFVLKLFSSCMKRM